MGKFEGFLKRFKRVDGFYSNILSEINDVYKITKLIVNSVVSTLPWGGYINQTLDFGSQVIDKITLLTNTCVDTSDKSKIVKYTNEDKRICCDTMFKLLIEYTKSQDERMKELSECQNTLMSEQKNLIIGNLIN